MGRSNRYCRRPRRYLVASKSKGDVNYEVIDNIRTAERSGRIIYTSHNNKILQRAKNQLQHNDNWLVYIDSMTEGNNVNERSGELLFEHIESQHNNTSLTNNNVDRFHSQQQTTINQKCETYLQNNNIVTQGIINNLSEKVSEVPFCQNENQLSEIPENNIFHGSFDNYSKDDNTASHQKEINVNNNIGTQEIINNLSEEVSEVPFCQNENQLFEIPENNIFYRSLDNCSKDDNTASHQKEINVNNNIVTQEIINNLSEEVSEVPFRQNENQRSEIPENNIFHRSLDNCSKADNTASQQKEINVNNNIVTQEIINNLSEEISEVPFCQNENQSSEIPENNIFHRSLDNCSKADNTASQQKEINVNNNIVTQEIINNLSEEISEVPFCQNENQRSEIPENNIFHRTLDNCSKGDNSASHQKEINVNKLLTISQYEFERPKSQNDRNLVAQDRIRQEKLSSQQQESGTALEINNVIIQEKEINAIQSVESMCFKRTSDRESKYYLDESEDEPFSADASEEEFVPDSFDESDESSMSGSSFDITGYIRTKIKGCKKKLKFTESTIPNVDRNVDCQPYTSKLYPDRRKSQDLSCDCVTSQPSTSKVCFEKSKSQSESTLEQSVCSVSSHYSPTSADISYARLNISLNTAVVTLKTENILHQGSYQCRLIDDDQTLMGFVHLSVPHNTHRCSFLDKTLTNKVAVIIFREHSKSTEQEVKIRVEYCLPQGHFKGKELKHEKMYLSPLFFSDEHTGKVDENITSDKSVQEMTSNKTRISKLHCCIYCEKMISEITKHLLRKHKEEREVVEILKMEINTKERNAALKRLRLMGDDRFNIRVLPNERIPLRQPTKRDLSSNVTCYKCSGSVSSTNFARHERNCNKNEVRPANREKVLAKARLLEETRSNPNQSIFLTLQENLVNALMKPMQAGVILHEIMSDTCLQLVTSRYAVMHRNVPGALKNDRQNLRRLARLLLEIREANPTLLDFEDCIVHSGYDTLLEGVFKMCDLDTSSGIFGKPALAQVMSSVITFMINALKDSYVRQGISKDTMQFKKLEDFMTLHKHNYSIYIGRSAGRTRLEQRANKQNELPSSHDVKQFSQYIIAEGKNAYTSIVENGFSYDAWLRLGKAVLAKIIVFNRRRVSEVASMTLELYENKTALSEQQKSNLSVLERSLADTYKIMALIGKRNHILHLLLDEDQCRYLDLFISFRKKAGVADSNKYLFGVPTNILYIDATHVLREFSVKCGAENPSLLRTTYLRKQVATLAQLLTLNDNQIAQVAKLMGHSQKVHEDVYRQDENLFQVTCWAKFLSVITDDDIGKYKGKTFEEIVNITNALEFNDDSIYDDYLTVNEITEEHPESSSLFSDDEARENANVIIKTPSKQLQRSSQVKKTTPQKSSKKTTPKKLTFSPKKTTPTKPTIAKILHQLHFSPPKNHARTRVSFNQRQVDIMTDYFNHYIISGQLASFDKCRQLIEENAEIFSGRYERDIYNWVQYQRNKFKKKMK